MKALLRFALSFLSPRGTPAGKTLSRRLQLEELEPRTVPSTAAPDFHILPSTVNATAPYMPAQIRHAYGFDRLPYDGTGETIAIVDAYDDPKIASDLWTFDQTFGIAAPPSFVKATPGGVPRSDPVWAGEISLDVEWAHAIAPKAKILLVEAASDSYTNLLNAVAYAAKQPGVVAVSMSWGGNDFLGEKALDSTFTTPSGHAGVVFVASSGDSGASVGAQWPASSPNVLAVGGTSLTITPQGAWVSESAWSGGGGGYSQIESEPSFQYAVQKTGKRGVPDVAYNADPNTGYYVYDAFPDEYNQTGWFAYGGTSAGAPQWAALIALADQGRSWKGLAPLPTGAAALYSLAPTDFHDITTGSNGYSAVSGYDPATGLGSPRADLVIAGLVKYVVPSPNSKTTSTTAPSSSSPTKPHVAAAVETAPAPVEVREDPAILEMLRELHAPRETDEGWPTI